MNRKILLVGVVAVILIIVFVLVWFNSSNQSSITNSLNGQNVGFPISNSIGQTTTTSSQGVEATFHVTSADGGIIQTRNFIKDSTTVKDPINSGYYYLGYHVNEGVPDSTATDNPPYIITYTSENQYFNVALLLEPIGTIRVNAEKYLMTRLGISQSQMCQLNYMVSVPSRVNSQYAGRDLGFSFCSGATKLPE